MTTVLGCTPPVDPDPIWAVLALIFVLLMMDCGVMILR